MNERYAVVEVCAAAYPIEAACRVMEVSRSGYYRWRQGVISQRQQADAQLGKTIEQAWESVHGRYGYRRVRALLKQQGITVGHDRVRRLMRQRGLSGRRPKAYKPRTTQSDLAAIPAPNLVTRHFVADAVNRLWLTDITYIPTRQGFLYTAAVLDMASRKIVGLAIDDHLRAELVVRAYQMAACERHPTEGLIVHSDRGSQYTSADFQAELAEDHALSSMSGKGDCYDNAPMESFWATLKAECALEVYDNHAQARADIFHYVFSFYNRTRLHSALDYRSPEQFEVFLETRHCPTN